MVRDLQHINEIIQYRDPHFHKDFPLILFWSHKSGCTSLVKWFYFQMGILDKALAYSPWIHDYETQVYKKQRNHKRDYVNALLRSEKKTYKLVRDPYTRTVSSFLMLFSNWNSDNSNWTREWERIRQYIYKDQNSKRGISFRQYLDYVQHNTNINPHLSQQYREGEEQFVRDYIYLENFKQEMLNIEKKYGLKRSPLTEIVKSPHHFSSLSSVKGDYSNIEFTDKAMKNVPTYESFYNDETRSLVAEIFSKDFSVYGYKK